MFRFPLSPRAVPATQNLFTRSSMRRALITENQYAVFIGQRFFSSKDPNEPMSAEWQGFRYGKRAVLELEDGTKVEGVSFGADKVVSLSFVFGISFVFTLFFFTKFLLNHSLILIFL